MVIIMDKINFIKSTHISLENSSHKQRVDLYNIVKSYVHIYKNTSLISTTFKNSAFINFYFYYDNNSNKARVTQLFSGTSIASIEEALKYLTYTSPEW
jgi:hypothetical protein